MQNGYEESDMAGVSADKLRMTLNSIIVPEFGLHLLSFRQLHSYLVFKGLAWSISLGAFLVIKSIVSEQATDETTGQAG